MRVRAAGVSESIAARRREIERSLLAINAARRRRRLSLVGEEGADEPAARLLRETFESLGGMFLLFGRYLADRRDLLSPPFAFALARMEDRAEPLHASAIHDLITGGLGGAARTIVSFDDEPYDSRVAWQSHRAVLTDGHPVVIRVSRPSLAAEADHADLLPGFVEVIAPAHAMAEARQAAVSDFLDEFRDSLDLRSEQDALTALAEEARVLDRVTAPRLRPSLSCAGVLTFESAGRATTASTRSPFGSDADAGLARRIAGAWFELVTLGRVFPAVVQPDATGAEGLRRIAFSSGPFRSMPAGAQASLRDYLFHAQSDPDRACEAFLRQVRGDVTPRAREELMRQFRQTVPFRDSEWCREGEGDGYEHYLWVHWRRATAAGCVPLAHMAGVYRGVTSLARTVRELAPAGSDPLGEAVADLRNAQALRDAAGAVDPAAVLSMTREYLQVAMALPDRIEAAMGRVSDGGLRLRVAAPDETRARRSSRMWLGVIVLLCVVLSEGPGALTSAVLVRALLIAALTMAIASMTEG